VGRNKVNAAASTERQPKGGWESRAGHDAAKATDSTRTDPERVLNLLGVLAAARFQGMVRNRRDPTRQSTSGKDRGYKAKG
jgi:hypothetical protein